MLVIDTTNLGFGFRDVLAVDDVSCEDALTPPTSMSQCRSGGCQCVTYVVAHRR